MGIVELFSSLEVPGVLLFSLATISIIDDLHKFYTTRLNSSTLRLIMVFSFSYFLRASETASVSGSCKE